MKRLVGLACAIQAFLFAPQVLRAQVPDSRDKVAEGEYWRWEDGHPIKDTAQSWVIWQAKEGLEIESKLPPNKGALLLAAIGHDLFKNESPEFREEARNAAVATEIAVRMDKSMAVSALHAEARLWLFPALKTSA